MGFSIQTDVEGIKYVVNYDYPHSSEDYIHRIGRTGRSDNAGTSYAFFTPSNFKQARDLVSVLVEAKQVVNPKLSELAQKFGGFGGKSRWGHNGGGFKGRDNGSVMPYKRFNQVGGFNQNGFNNAY